MTGLSADDLEAADALFALATQDKGGGPAGDKSSTSLGAHPLRRCVFLIESLRCVSPSVRTPPAAACF